MWQPTLDFDVLPEELHLVLPREMWRTPAACSNSLRELAHMYKLLLKDKPDPAEPRTGWGLSLQSATCRLVHDVRHESRGVAFDSKGQVVAP